MSEVTLACSNNLFVQKFIKVITHESLLKAITRTNQQKTILLQLVDAAPPLQRLMFPLKGVWYNKNEENQPLNVFSEMLKHLNNAQAIVVMVNGDSDAISHSVDNAVSDLSFSRRKLLMLMVYDSTKRSAILVWDGGILKDNIEVKGVETLGEYLILKRLIDV
ncbi:hypothetical protein EV368DRAFT_63456 [Lentinula lateritia]|nr:hypothetical protein EV368DRAFT_63456 [Lentinula lateritia]